MIYSLSSRILDKSIKSRKRVYFCTFFFALYRLLLSRSRHIFVVAFAVDTASISRRVRGRSGRRRAVCCIESFRWITHFLYFSRSSLSQSDQFWALLCEAKLCYCSPKKRKAQKEAREWCQWNKNGNGTWAERERGWVGRSSKRRQHSMNGDPNVYELTLFLSNKYVFSVCTSKNIFFFLRPKTQNRTEIRAKQPLDSTTTLVFLPSDFTTQTFFFVA